MRRGFLLLVPVLLFAGARDAGADDVRPASLTIHETAPGRHEVRWVTPLRGTARLRATPRLPPDAAILAGSHDRQVVGDALVETWRFHLPGGLSGREVGVEGLALTRRSVLVHVRLADGRTHRAFLGGARARTTVPPAPGAERRRATEHLHAAFREGVRRALHVPAVLLFGAALGLAGGPGALALLGLVVLGQLLGAATGWSSPAAVGLGESFLALAGALVLREAWDGRARRLAGLAFLAGVLHGALAGPAQPLASSLALALGLTGPALAAGLAGWGLGRILARPGRRALLAVLGAALVALALEGATRARPPAAAVREAAALPLALEVPRAADGPAGATLPMSPVEDLHAFLDIGVFETRLDVLVRIAPLAEGLGLGELDGSTIPPKAQPALLQRLAASLRTRAELRIDGSEVTPRIGWLGFVTQDAQGTWLRETPQVERRAEAVAGVSLAVATPRVPQQVRVRFRDLPPGLTVLRARVLDPEASREVTLEAESAVLEWENALLEDPLPGIEAVALRTTPTLLPSLSLLLAVATLLATGFLWIRRRGRAAALVLLAGAILALGALPHLAVPSPVALDEGEGPTASEARAIAGALLENVYRALNHADEEEVYRRLATSMTPEPLERAYLEGRSSLAVARAGGARAHVDVVELIEIEGVEPRADGAFAAEAAWTVAGSVTHFGHRHFRQNLYRGDLEIVPVEGTWKIRRVDVRATERRR